jgi:hypothetical protein
LPWRAHGRRPGRPDLKIGAKEKARQDHGGDDEDGELEKDRRIEIDDRRIFDGSLDGEAEE